MRMPCSLGIAQSILIFNTTVTVSSFEFEAVSLAWLWSSHAIISPFKSLSWETLYFHECENAKCQRFFNLTTIKRACKPLFTIISGINKREFLLSVKRKNWFVYSKQQIPNIWTFGIDIVYASISFVFCLHKIDDKKKKTTKTTSLFYLSLFFNDFLQFPPQAYNCVQIFRQISLFNNGAFCTKSIDQFLLRSMAWVCSIGNIWTMLNAR